MIFKCMGLAIHVQWHLPGVLFSYVSYLVFNKMGYVIFALLLLDVRRPS